MSNNVPSNTPFNAPAEETRPETAAANTEDHQEGQGLNSVAETAAGAEDDLDAESRSDTSSEIDVHARDEAIANELFYTSKVDALEADFEHARARIAELQLNNRDLEGQMSTLNTKVKDFEDQNSADKRDHRRREDELRLKAQNDKDELESTIQKHERVIKLLGIQLNFEEKALDDPAGDHENCEARVRETAEAYEGFVTMAIARHQIEARSRLNAQRKLERRCADFKNRIIRLKRVVKETCVEVSAQGRVMARAQNRHDRVRLGLVNELYDRKMQNRRQAEEIARLRGILKANGIGDDGEYDDEEEEET